MSALGQRRWVIAAGRIPPGSDGPEPEYTSRDELSILNSGEGRADVELMIFYSDRDPVGPYEFEVAARRVRNVRVNDLIDPEAPPMGCDYAIVIEASQPVVVQQVRLDSRRAEDSIFSTIAYPASG